MSDKQKQCLKWFDLKNYEYARYIDPGYWSWQLLMRSIIIKDPELEINKNAFENIKEKGVKGLEWEFNELFSKHSQGIIFPSTSINDANASIKLTEKIKQNHLKNGYMTEYVTVLDIDEFMYYYDLVDPNTLELLIRKNKLLNNNKNELNKNEKNTIINTTDLFHNVVDIDNNAIIEIDLNASNEVIKSNFNTVLKALRKDNHDKSTAANALTTKSWFQRANKLVDDAILPFLDLLIFQKQENIKFTYLELENILFKNKKYSTTPIGKVKDTTKPNALKLLSRKEIDALKSLYSSKDLDYWKSYTGKNLRQFFPSN